MPSRCRTLEASIPRVGAEETVRNILGLTSPKKIPSLIASVYKYPPLPPVPKKEGISASFTQSKLRMIYTSS